MLLSACTLPSAWATVSGLGGGERIALVYLFLASMSPDQDRQTPGGQGQREESLEALQVGAHSACLRDLGVAGL